MQTPHDDLDACDAALDRAFGVGSTPAGASEVLARVIRADESTPEPERDFIHTLRARLMGASIPSGRGDRSVGVGIVATPYPLAPRARLIQLAAAAALCLGFYAFGAGWSGDAPRLLGVPTAQASATIELPTPTPTATPHQSVHREVKTDAETG